MAVAAAIGSAGKRGVLVKGGLHLEHLGQVRVVAFDKTGTLTRGTPVVTDVVPLGGIDEETVLPPSLDQRREYDATHTNGYRCQEGTFA